MKSTVERTITVKLESESSSNLAVLGEGDYIGLIYQPQGAPAVEYRGQVKEIHDKFIYLRTLEDGYFQKIKKIKYENICSVFDL